MLSEKAKEKTIDFFKDLSPIKRFALAIILPYIFMFLYAGNFLWISSFFAHTFFDLGKYWVGIIVLFFIAIFPSFFVIFYQNVKRLKHLIVFIIFQSCTLYWLYYFIFFVGCRVFGKCL